MVAKLALLLVYAIPVAFVPAFVLRGDKDVSIGPNFTILGLLGLLAALVVAILLAVRRRRSVWPWLGAAVANLAVVLVAADAFDWSGGGH